MSDTAPSPAAPTRRRGLTVNTLAQAAPLLTGYLGSFASAPIILASLGLRDFGIWALTGALAQYASLLDFGVGYVLVRFIALHVARKEPEKIGEVIGTGFVTSTLMSLALIGASFLAASPVAHAMHVAVPEMRLLLLCSTVLFAASMFTNVLNAFATGMQEMVGPNMATTVGALLNLTLSVGAVLSSHSLERYAEANALASVLTVMIVAGVAYRTMRGRVRVRVPSLAMMREILTFSVKNQAQTASDLINLETDKIIIALAIGPAAAGAYEIANRIATAAKAIGALAFSAMLPTITAAGVERSESELKALYVRLTRVTTGLGTPVLLLVAAMPATILHAWLGHVPPDSTAVLSGLSLAYLLLGTSGVGYVLAQAKGRPDLPAKAAVATAVANLAFTLALEPLLGIWGVLIGTIVAFSAGSLFQVWLVHRAFHIPLGDYCSAVSPALVLGIAAALPLLAINFGFEHSGRLVQVEAAIGGGLIFAVLYLLGAQRWGLLPPALARRLPLRDRRQPRGVGPVVEA